MKKYKSKSWTVILLSAVIMAAVTIGVCSCNLRSAKRLDADQDHHNHLYQNHRRVRRRQEKITPSPALYPLPLRGGLG